MTDSRLRQRGLPADDLPTVHVQLRPPPELPAAAPPPASSPPPPIFGEYELLERLGRGGMGVVYRARHLRLGRVVALKVVAGGSLASEPEVRRFHAEAEAAARLEHPGIVPLYEVGRYQGQHYYTMALVDGGSLADRLTHGPLPPAEAAELVRRVAEAVDYAHRQGIVHRDLKPGNVLVAGGGWRVAGGGNGESSSTHHPPPATLHPKIIDFGLAMKLGGGGGLTATGEVLGTPEYMAPEQAGGKAALVGPATDIYALGAILYCALTGRPPFQAATGVETLLQITSREPAPPRELNPAIDRDLETITLKCLHKDPRRRYATADGLADDLRRWRAGEPISARPVGWAERTWRIGRRYPTATVAAVALLLSTAVSTWLAVRASAHARRADANAAAARANARDANDRAYLSDVWLAHGYLDDNLVSQADDLLDRQRPGRTDGVERRGFEWYYARRVCRPAALAGVLSVRANAVAVSPAGPGVALYRTDGTVELRDGVTGPPRWAVAAAGRGLTISSDGRLLAGFTDDGVTWVRDAATGRVLQSFNGGGRVVRLAIAPDGRSIATAGKDGRVVVWDVAAGSEKFACRGLDAEVRAITFRPDGQALAAGDAAGTIRLWDAAGRPAGERPRGRGPVAGLAFGPDGRLAVTDDHAVRVWAADGRELWTARAELDMGGPVAFSPDGRLLAGGRRAVRVWDAATGHELHRWRGHQSPIQGTAFTADGAALVTLGMDALARVWDLGAAPNPLLYRGHASQVTAVAASPDGRLAASAGGTWQVGRYDGGELRLWDLATGRDVAALAAAGSAGVCDVAFAPGGRLLASAGGDWDAAAGRYRYGAVRLWDVATGAEVACHRDHAAGVLSVAFSADGRRLASGGMDRAVVVRDLAAGRVLWTAADHTALVTRVVFSPDGRTVVSAGFDGTVRVRDADTGAVRYQVAGAGLVSGLAISPDGTRLAVGSYAQQVVVRDLATGAEVTQLRGFQRGVTSVAYSPDGRRVVATCEDGTARLFDAASGQELLRLRGHTDVARTVAFTADGRRVLTGGWDRTVRVHDAGAPGPDDR